MTTNVTSDNGKSVGLSSYRRMGLVGLSYYEVWTGGETLAGYVAVNRGEFLKAVAEECNVIITEHNDLPKVHREDDVDGYMGCLVVDGTYEEEYTAKEHREFALTHLAVAEFLEREKAMWERKHEEERKQGIAKLDYILADPKLQPLSHEKLIETLYDAGVRVIDNE